MRPSRTHRSRSQDRRDRSDGLRELVDAGCHEVALLVLGPHQSSVSWDWYLKYASEAAERLAAKAPRIAAVVAPWASHPGYAQAVAARVRESIAGWSAQRLAAAKRIFTAHAIPAPVRQARRKRVAATRSAGSLAPCHTGCCCSSSCCRCAPLTVTRPRSTPSASTRAPR